MSHQKPALNLFAVYAKKKKRKVIFRSIRKASFNENGTYGGLPKESPLSM